MPSDKVIGRVMTDLRLAPLYENLLRATGRIIIDQLHKRLEHVQKFRVVRKAFEKRRKVHIEEFQRCRNTFLQACGEEGVEIPSRDVSIESLRLFLVRQLK